LPVAAQPERLPGGLLGLWIEGGVGGDPGLFEVGGAERGPARPVAGHVAQMLLSSGNPIGEQVYGLGHGSGGRRGVRPDRDAGDRERPDGECGGECGGGSGCDA
jgi:hypothetical protein